MLIVCCAPGCVTLMLVVPFLRLPSSVVLRSYYLCETLLDCTGVKTSSSAAVGVSPSSGFVCCMHVLECGRVSRHLVLGGRDRRAVNSEPKGATHKFICFLKT